MIFREKVFIAGHHGLVGSALTRAWQAAGYRNIVGRRSAELDLRCQQAVEEFFAAEKPDYVLLAAAKVGGIGANSAQPAPFLYDNLMMAVNVIRAHSLKKMLPWFLIRMAEHLLISKIIDNGSSNTGQASVHALHVVQAHNSSFVI